MAKILNVMAHSRDCTVFSYDEDGVELWEYDGYVVGGLGVGSEGSDDVELRIDIETGKILGWDTEKVKARLAELVEGND